MIVLARLPGARTMRSLSIVTRGLALLSTIAFVTMLLAIAGRPGLIDNVTEAFLAPPGPAERPTPPPGTPDIFVYLIDGYPGAEASAQAGATFDAAAFPDALRQRGFTVHDDARTNYLITRLVIPSMLEGRHLDDIPALAEPFGPDQAVDAQRLRSVTEHAASLAAIRAAGYDVMWVSSGFSHIDTRNVDRRIEAPGPSELEVAILRQCVPRDDRPDDRSGVLLRGDARARSGRRTTPRPLSRRSRTRGHDSSSSTSPRRTRRRSSRPTGPPRTAARTRRSRRRSPVPSRRSCADSGRSSRSPRLGDLTIKGDRRAAGGRRRLARDRPLLGSRDRCRLGSERAADVGPARAAERDPRDPDAGPPGPLPRADDAGQRHRDADQRVSRHEMSRTSRTSPMPTTAPCWTSCPSRRRPATDGRARPRARPRTGPSPRPGRGSAGLRRRWR